MVAERRFAELCFVHGARILLDLGASIAAVSRQRWFENTGSSLA